MFHRALILLLLAGCAHKPLQPQLVEQEETPEGQPEPPDPGDEGPNWPHLLP